MAASAEADVFFQAQRLADEANAYVLDVEAAYSALARIEAIWPRLDAPGAPRFTPISPLALGNARALRVRRQAELAHAKATMVVKVAKVARDEAPARPVVKRTRRSESPP